MIRRVLFVVFAPVLIYLFAGTMGGYMRVGNDVNGHTGKRIALLPGSIHTDILLPATSEVRAALSFLTDGGLAINNPNVVWVMVGWGARDFYTATGQYTDLSVRPIWRAITGDSAVMRVTLVGQITNTSGLTWIDMNDAQFDMLLAEVRSSFAGPIPVPLDHPGLSGRDLFYPATGRFHILRTCNVWVGNVLRKAGVRIGIWTPFTWSLP